jgi:hypothetical protein
VEVVTPEFVDIGIGLIWLAAVLVFWGFLADATKGGRR